MAVPLPARGLQLLRVAGAVPPAARAAPQNFLPSQRQQEPVLLPGVPRQDHVERLQGRARLLPPCVTSLPRGNADAHLRQGTNRLTNPDYWNKSDKALDKLMLECQWSAEMGAGSLLVPTRADEAQPPKP